MNIISAKNLAFTTVLGAAMCAFSACNKSMSNTTDAAADKPLNAYWTEVNKGTPGLPNRPAPLPSNYRLLRLDMASLRQQLTPQEGGTDKTMVEMPLPNGRQATFTVTPAEVMDPKLASRYPGIKAYKGTSVKNPATALRMELSPRGLKASITDGSRRILIDPYMPGDTVYYLTYERDEVIKQSQDKRYQNMGEPQKPVPAYD